MNSVASTVDLAGPGSATSQHQLAHLVGPFVGSARLVPATIDATGAATIDWSPRHPVVLAALRTDLTDEAIRVSATIHQGGATTTLPGLTFAPWSERGATILLFAPVVDDEPGIVPPFTVTVAAERQSPDGAVTPIATAELAAVFDIAVLEGNVARLVHLASREKQELRRAAREVAAMRTLALARRDALDRLGADVGVARFDDELVFANGELFARQRPATGPDRRESDDSYRRRLAMYRGHTLATPGRVRRILQGQSDPHDLAVGLMADVPGLSLLEPGSRFAVAVRLVALGDPAERANLLAVIRRDRLILPSDDPADEAVHAARPLATTAQAAAGALRRRLRESFDFAPGAGIAPALATALDRAGQVLRALGIVATHHVLRAQDPTGGSRYELGAAVDITPLPAGELTAVRKALADGTRPRSADGVAEAIIDDAKGDPSAAVDEDDQLAWLWRRCGLETVHRTSTGSLLLSHLPMYGLTIDGPDGIAAAPTAAYEGHFHAPGDPGGNALVVAGVAGALASWIADGEPAWQSVDDATAAQAWPTATVPDAVARNVLAAAGLPVVTDPATTAASLAAIPGELYETIELDAGLAAAIHAGDPNAGPRLRRLVDTLRANHLASALPLLLPGQRVLIVIGATSLPLAGTNVNERRATGFRWYVVPVGDGRAAVKPLGSRTTLQAQKPGVVALVALGYIRTGAPDPYEVRVELADDTTLLRPDQYEFLMNLLMRVCPIGVEINTFALRRGHVDLDGDGVADPLGPALSRTFRTFQRRRSRGIYDPIEENNHV